MWFHHFPTVRVPGFCSLMIYQNHRICLPWSTSKILEDDTTCRKPWLCDNLFIFICNLSLCTLPGGEYVDKRIIDIFCSGSNHSITQMLSLLPLSGSFLHLLYLKGHNFIYVLPRIEVTCFLASDCLECC